MPIVFSVLQVVNDMKEAKIAVYFVVLMLLALAVQSCTARCHLPIVPLSQPANTNRNTIPNPN